MAQDLNHVDHHLQSIEFGKQTASKTTNKDQSSTLPQRLVEQLWIRMAEIYGSRWVSQYGERDSGTWAKGLTGISPEQLAHGLDNCLRSENPWPPTLPEFRAYCRPRTPACHKPFPKALPKPRLSYEEAKPLLEKMKDALKQNHLD